MTTAIHARVPRPIPPLRAIAPRPAAGGAAAGVPAIPRPGLSPAQVRRPASEMVDFTKVLTPDQLRQVDPRVLDFYRHPQAYDLYVAGELVGSASRLVLGKLVPALADLGHITAEERLAEAELYRDAAGRTHWDRYTVIDGRRERLFIARFEAVGGQVRETFDVRGHEVALYFDVVPHAGGLRLTLDRERSAPLARLVEITFTTLPASQGVISVGRFADRAGVLRGNARFRMVRRTAAEIGAPATR